MLGAWYYRRTGSYDANNRLNVPTPTATIAALLRQGGATQQQATAISTAYAGQLPVIPVAYTGSQPMG